jgi:hypothetical protein
MERFFPCLALWRENSDSPPYWTKVQYTAFQLFVRIIFLDRNGQLTVRSPRLPVLVTQPKMKEE